jgi:hypothetical protein
MFWLARKSTVTRAVCGRALSCWKTYLRRLIAGSMCGVKTSFLYRAALRLPWMCTSWVYRRRIWHPTSSHFLHRNCRPQGRSSCEPLIPASVDTCTAISFLQHESWFMTESDSPPVLQVPALYSVAPSDVSVLRQSKYVWRVQAVFTETVSDCLCRYSSETWDIWWCFSCCYGPVSRVKYPDVEILDCWCVRDVLQANGGHNRYWLWNDVIWTLWTLMW